MLATAWQSAGAQIVLDTTSTNPTCTKAFGHAALNGNGNVIYSNVGNGSIGIIASGGTAPYTYQLTGSYLQNGFPQYVNVTQNNGYFPGLNAGTYNVIVTDANGQQAFYSRTLTDTQPQPSISFMDILTSPSSCTSADGSMQIFGTGGTPPYTYSIDGGMTFTSSNILTGLRPGFYEGILMDANGCLAEYTPSNGPYQTQTCGVAGGISFIGVTGCGNDASITTYASKDMVPYHDTDPWNFSYDGVHYYPPNDGLSQDTASGFSPGIHDVYIKDTVTGAILIAGFTIVKSCYIYITFIDVDASCGGSDGSVTVIASSGTLPYTYTIDGVHYQNSNVFTGLAAGNYSVTVKDANGEVSSAVATVYDKCPTVTAVSTNANCGQPDGTITATGHKGTLPYQFSIDGVNFQSGNVFTGVPAGNYTVTIRDQKGFTSTTSVIVGDNCLSAALTGVNTSCGRTNGSITAVGGNGTAPYQYALNGGPFQFGGVFNGLAAGPYTVTIQDFTGLTATSTITLVDEPAPQISLQGTPAGCFDTGGSIAVIRTGGTAPFQYSLDNGVIFQPDSVFSSLDSAAYTVLISDSNGCRASVSLQLSALPTPVFSLGKDTVICSDNPLTLEAPDSAGYQYQWQDNSVQRLYTVSSSGTYSVTVTNSSHCSAGSSRYVRVQPVNKYDLGDDTTLCYGQTLLIKSTSSLPDNVAWSTGSTTASLLVNSPGRFWLLGPDSACVRSDTVVVRYQAAPAASLGNDTAVCDGQTVLLNAGVAAGAGVSYQWQDGSAGPTFTVSQPGTYSVKITANGCDTVIDVKIAYISKPMVALVPDTTICVTQQLVLDAGAGAGGGTGVSYQWQDGSTSPALTVSQAGTYTVNVTNQCGKTTDSTVVSIEDCACRFYVPTAFTPNGDGKNDLFQPKYLCLFSNYQLRVYNRWGQMVFSSSNPAEGWDGRVGGSPQPAGVYVWEMAFKDNLTGKMLKKNGTVVLIR